MSQKGGKGAVNVIQSGGKCHINGDLPGTVRGRRTRGPGETTLSPAPRTWGGSQFKNNHSTKMCGGSGAGSYLRLIDSCITQLKAEGPSRTCNESQEEAEETRGPGETTPAPAPRTWGGVILKTRPLKYFVCFAINALGFIH